MLTKFANSISEPCLSHLQEVDSGQLGLIDAVYWASLALWYP